ALKSYALTREGVRAASMLFDPDTRRPLFRLAYDQVGASQALDVARAHKLPESILRRAEHYLLQDGQDAGLLLERLNRLAAKREEELVRLRQEQEKTRQSTQKMRDQMEKERTRLYEEVRGKAAELMRAWKENRVTSKQALKEMSRLRAGLAPSNPEGAASILPRPEHFAPGQSVFHCVFNKSGRITDVDERRKRVRLEMNGVSLWAEMKDLREKAATEVRPAAAGVSRPAREGLALRLDLRGMRAEHAIAEVERFLDKALLAGSPEVEIIHGRGTGALRRQVHEFLRAFPAVATFAIANEDRGGDGMTVVTLR
ncbi:MAG: Smr/MutS family protein, partial [Desulfovibrionaceae bacterium]|nr:Smr/MutS family protein [Desulfovibrionaceae bacterium]